MASSYPTGLDAFSTSHLDDGTEIIHASVVNDNSDGINKIEAELGTLPKGTYASVKARLDALEKPTVNSQSVSYTLVLGDASKTIEFTAAGAVNLSIPTDASVNFPIGTYIGVFQYGAGQVTIQAVTSGTTSLRARGGALKIAGQYGMASAWKRAANEWVITGDLSV